MRRPNFHRWLIIVLLLGQLLLGAPVHAASHESHESQQDMSDSQTQEAPCPDHADATQSADHAGAAQAGDDCCPQGDCGCAHASGFPSAPPQICVAVAGHYPIADLPPHAPQRLSVLLRPPA